MTWRFLSTSLVRYTDRMTSIKLVTRQRCRDSVRIPAGNWLPWLRIFRFLHFLQTIVRMLPLLRHGRFFPIPYNSAILTVPCVSILKASLHSQKKQQMEGIWYYVFLSMLLFPLTTFEIISIFIIIGGEGFISPRKIHYLHFDFPTSIIKR
jgi:hypothetical protein